LRSGQHKSNIFYAPSFALAIKALVTSAHQAEIVSWYSFKLWHGPSAQTAAQQQWQQQQQQQQ
jgi:hypothetical protein